MSPPLLDYDALPVGSVVRWADGHDDDAGVVEDGDPWSGLLDVRWSSWTTDTRPTDPTRTRLRHPTLASGIDPTHPTRHPTVALTCGSRVSRIRLPP